MNERKLDVYLGERLVGTLAETVDHRVAFAYVDAWLEDGFAISAVVYNLGTNIFFGEVCYITKSLTAVLQLGVTMDYSIFLLNSFENYKKKYDSKDRAMAHAIADTFKSVAGSSVTTIAGFLALCVMTFALGRNVPRL